MIQEKQADLERKKKRKIFQLETRKTMW